VTDREPSIADEVERYLRTGETAPHHAAWPGNGFIERANRAHEDLRGDATSPKPASAPASPR